MKKQVSMKITAGLVCLLALGACDGMSTRDQRMLSGGAIGAGGGALIGAATGGSALTGAAIGAGAGAIGGYIYDKNKE